MQSLNNVVASGKVLYLGISNTPARVVSKANQYARDHGFRQFSMYQGKWSAACRDFERDIIPMCISEGMGIAPWGVLGSGAFKSEEQRNSKEGRKIEEVPEAAIMASKVLERIAKRKKTAITSIALAYIMHKTPYVFPIVGGRNIEHFKSNIEALSLDLSQEEIEEIEGAVPFDIGYPMNFLGHREDESPLNKIGGHCDYVGHVKVCVLKFVTRESF
jgi:aryl-alcohol dehydrogenase-like predicted oxidoreductase